MMASRTPVKKVPIHLQVLFLSVLFNRYLTPDCCVNNRMYVIITLVSFSPVVNLAVKKVRRYALIGRYALKALRYK